MRQTGRAADKGSDPWLAALSRLLSSVRMRIRMRRRIKMMIRMRIQMRIRLKIRNLVAKAIMKTASIYAGCVHDMRMKHMYEGDFC